MRKIPTLFRRDPDDMRRVLPEVTPGCEWVLAGEGTPTRKYDGTCVMKVKGIDGHGWWARREVKPGKQPPSFFIPVETDENTGKTVGWEPIGQSPFFKFFAEAREKSGRAECEPGTYELVGPKINGNPERLTHHTLIAHAEADPVHAPRVVGDVEQTFKILRAILTDPTFDGIEGVVWHHPDGRMAKLKAKDFSHDV